MQTSMPFLSLALIAGLTVTVPALAAPADAPLPAEPVRPAPIHLGLSTWFAASPTWNAHYTVALTAPVGSTPWVITTNLVPTLGSGHLSGGHRFEIGPVTVIPALGFRFFGAAAGTLSADARTFEVGPEARIGATVSLLPWLSLWAGAGYAPYLAVPYGGGPGSYLDGNISLQASYERVSLSAGYGGLLFNGGQAGNPSGNLAMGGPIIGVLTRF